MRAIQFETMRRLSRVYEEHGLRASFYAEVMQQLAHVRHGEDHPELRKLAEEWEALLRDTYARGHDVQLHLHPQWTNASYADGRWQLSGDWSLLSYPPAQVAQMVKEGKAYLEEVIRPVDPDYRCVAFRSGSWCIAPGASALEELVAQGIVFDASIGEGIHYDTQHLQLDYRHLDEAFLPYHPVMEDARRVAGEPQPIVCVPTHSFAAHPAGYGLRLAARTFQRRLASARRWTGPYVAASDTRIPEGGYERETYFTEEWPSPGRRRLVPGKRISDLSRMSHLQMRQMLADIRRRARASGHAVVPVVLANHTKELGDFRPLELFAATVAAADDLEVITLAELAASIRQGDCPVRAGAA
jgi:hypothetical protein